MSRPRILVNVASSLDGKIDTAARKAARISSLADKARPYAPLHVKGRLEAVEVLEVVGLK
jgi:riboflavin biosynthesis pyrimidine reductase